MVEEKVQILEARKAEHDQANVIRIDLIFIDVITAIVLCICSFE